MGKGSWRREKESCPWRKASEKHKLREDPVLESQGPGRDLTRCESRASQEGEIKSSGRRLDN